MRVAVISNVQNVRLQRRHRPTDDASTRQWHGSQQTGPVRTTRRSDARVLVINKQMHALSRTFSRFGAAKIIQIG